MFFCHPFFFNRCARNVETNILKEMTLKGIEGIKKVWRSQSFVKRGAFTVAVALGVGRWFSTVFFPKKNDVRCIIYPPRGGRWFINCRKLGQIKRLSRFFWFKSLVLRLSAFRVVLSKEVSLWIQVLLRTYFGPPQIVPFPCIPSSGSLDL